MSRGITEQKVANQVIELVGRHPLALKLAADLVQREKGDLSEVKEASVGRSVIERLRGVWKTTDISGRLYQRLLLHIVDPEVRKLAHPGLVLRHITPQIIREVLAGICDVTVEDDEDAQRLFDRLQNEVSLVASAEPGVLRHRPDVRQIMLPLLLEDDSVRARQIQQRAVDYYQKQRGTAARAEEIYYRLMLGEEPSRVQERWMDGLEGHLRPVLDELPTRAQAFVAARIQAERPETIWQQADPEDWELHTEHRIRDLLKMGDFERVEQALQERRERTPASRLHAMEAMFLHAQGHLKKAKTAAVRALDHFSLLEDSEANTDLVAEMLEITDGPNRERTVNNEMLLNQQELYLISEAISAANITFDVPFRFHLLHGINRQFTASLPVAPTPLVQLSLDLQALNRAGQLQDGSVPLIQWLENAVHLLDTLPQQKTVQKLLNEVKQRQASRT
jgi:hypothetical protein